MPVWISSLKYLQLSYAKPLNRLLITYRLSVHCLGDLLRYSSPIGSFIPLQTVSCPQVRKDSSANVLSSVLFIQWKLTFEVAWRLSRFLWIGGGTTCLEQNRQKNSSNENRGRTGAQRPSCRRWIKNTGNAGIWH